MGITRRLGLQMSFLVNKQVVLWTLCYLFAVFTPSAYAHGNITEHDHPIKGRHSSDTGPKHHLVVEKTIKLSIQKIEDNDDKKIVQIKLVKVKDDKPEVLENLKEVHTQKIHLLIIDDSLEDYSHLHPKALKEPGLYEFAWHPKKQGNYRIWADLFPLDTHVQEYVTADLTSGIMEHSTISHATVMQSTLDGYTFKLSFDKKNIMAGKPAMGRINITDDKGNPIKDLEPIMGAFAHIVGFSEDWNTVIHVHPMGEEPSKSTDRGGPEIQFHIEPKKRGFIKLFAQLNIKGKEIFVPFGVTVK